MKAQMFNDQRWIRNDQFVRPEPQMIRLLFEGMLLEAGFGVVNYMEHRFEPHGFTAIWLLSESHLAIHTFPEEELVYVEMSSCVEEQYKRYLELMIDCFDKKE